jgi:hypothetical protein
MSALLTIKGKHQFTPPGIFLGYVLLPIGLFVLIVPFVLNTNTSIIGHILCGLFITLIGLIYSTTKEEFFLDTDKMLYKKGTFFLGIRSGDWVKLPEIEKVIVLPVKSSYRISDAIRPTMTFTESKCRVMLYVKDAVRGIIVAELSRAKATEIADLLSEKLGVHVEEVLDA